VIRAAHVAPVVALFAAMGCVAQTLTPADLAEVPQGLPVSAAAASPLNGSRIFGVIPDYQTITDLTGSVKPLTPKQKWTLALKETVDPFNVLNAAMGAAFSQRGNQTPKYGEGGAAYARRFGAALADFGSQNFFSAGVLATLLHQDPRYYRKGPGTGVARRAIYSVSRLVIARQDSGAPAFNASGIGGMMLGIAVSNLYYPAVSVRGSVMACRLSTSLSGGIMGNLMSEFWPDLQKRFFHRRHSVTSAERSQLRPGSGMDSHQ
jgi:hypothetical protein